MDIRYENFQEAIDNLVSQIRDDEIEFDCVVGVSRGGLVPAVVLSHRLQVPFRPIEWSLRDSHKKYIPPDVVVDAWDGSRILIVDDIIDSGETFITIRNRFGDSFKNVKIGCLVYNKAQNLVVPDYYYHVINRGEYKEWVNFWWESK